LERHSPADCLSQEYMAQNVRCDGDEAAQRIRHLSTTLLLTPTFLVSFSMGLKCS
jgi:hypothetical protein